jgi:hypothetical protein
MPRLSLPDAQYAVKTAWRFVALVSCMAFVLALALATAPWWVRLHEILPSLFAALFCMSLLVLVCFAFAGVAWAVYALLCRSSVRRSALWALFAALVSLVIVGGYALGFAGVIRLH